MLNSYQTQQSSNLLHFFHTDTGTYKLVLIDRVKVAHNPADKWYQNDVVLTSMQRDDVASTIIRHHFYVMCPLGGLLSYGQWVTRSWAQRIFHKRQESTISFRCGLIFPISNRSVRATEGLLSVTLVYYLCSCSSCAVKTDDR